MVHFLYFPRFIFWVANFGDNPDGVVQLGLAENTVGFQFGFCGFDARWSFGCFIIFFLAQLVPGLLLIWGVVWFVVVSGYD